MGINWRLFTERMVGRGHPTLSDTTNRALRQVLSSSGYDPDAATFPGLYGPVQNILARGATGLGTGDDGPAIQAAHDALPTAGGWIIGPVGSFRLATAVTITKYVRFICAGRGVLAGAAPTRFIKASSLSGPAIILAGGNNAHGSILEGFQLDGEVGNIGDGIAVRTNYCTLRDITVNGMGQDGIRIGADAATNVNLWLLENIFSRGNGRHGFNIDDPAGLPDANAGTILHCDASVNAGDGLRIGKTRFCYFFNLTVQANTGAGVRLTADALQHTFFGGDLEEANGGGNLIVETGAADNSFYGTSVTTGITDNGTRTYIVFRDGRTNRAGFRTPGNATHASFADGDATPSVAAGSVFQCTNTSPTNITAFDDGYDGQVIIVRLNNRTGITHNNSFIRLQNNISIVADAVTPPVDANAHIALYRAGGIWFEWFRSKSPIVDNSATSPKLNDAFIVGGFRQTVDGWTQDNVAANQTNVELTRAVGRWRAPRAGSVTGVIVTATEARTAGTLTATVFKNTGLAGAAGATIGLTAVLDGTNTSRKATTQLKDTDAFAAGDELYAVVTTDAGWLPTTSDIRIAIEVET